MWPNIEEDEANRLREVVKFFLTIHGEIPEGVPHIHDVKDIADELWPGE